MFEVMHIALKQFQFSLTVALGSHFFPDRSLVCIVVKIVKGKALLA